MKINKESLIIENDRIYLRPLLVEDITGDYINGMNDPEVNKYLVNVRLKTQTRETVEDYVRSNLDSPSSVLFGIFIKKDPVDFIGTVRVSGIDYFHCYASIGVCLFAKRAWKQGYAIQAVSIVKNYLFESLGLHYLEAGLYAENRNSINLFRRAGFSEAYRVKNKFRHEDSFKDTIYFAVTNPLFDTSLFKQDKFSNELKVHRCKS